MQELLLFNFSLKLFIWNILHMYLLTLHLWRTQRVCKIFPQIPAATATLYQMYEMHGWMQKAILFLGHKYWLFKLLCWS